MTRRESERRRWRRLRPAPRIALEASAIPPVALTYKLDYIREWGVVMILPSASAKWWAIKVDRRDGIFASGFQAP